MELPEELVDSSTQESHLLRQVLVADEEGPHEAWNLVLPEPHRFPQLPGSCKPLSSLKKKKLHNSKGPLPPLVMIFVSVLLGIAPRHGRQGLCGSATPPFPSHHALNYG